MTLPNLTLLSEHINTEIGNRSFADKQSIVLNDIAEGYFVPNCTLMVFTKAYTLSSKKEILQDVVPKNDNAYQSCKNVFWNIEDRKAYIMAVSETLTKYLPTNKKGVERNE